jgi:hypothetical protein
LFHHLSYNFFVSVTAANKIVAFVAALEETELLCTVVSDIGTGVNIPPQGPQLPNIRAAMAQQRLTVE